MTTSHIPAHGDLPAEPPVDADVVMTTPAWQYGSPLAEQRAMHEAAAVIDRSDRGVLVVAGADRLDWLHSICSQHVATLRDGESTQALVLSPHGHVEQHWQLTELDGQIWLDVAAGQSAEALGYLQKMRFLKRVDPADVSAEFAVLSVFGPLADDVVARAGFPVPASSAAAPPVDLANSRSAPSQRRNPVPEMVPPTTGARALSGGGIIRRALADRRIDLIVTRSAQAATLQRLCDAGAMLAGSWALDAWRVENSQPKLGVDTDHRTLAHEVGWIGSAVHLDKGCYRGQETVARLQNLGRPPRRLVTLHLSGDSDVLPEPGSEVRVDDRVVGFLGTAVHHWELGPVALAVVKRGVSDDAVLQIADFAATIDHAH